ETELCETGDLQVGPAPFGARPLRLTARTLRAARTSSPTTALPIAPIAPKTTCSDASGCVIAVLPGCGPRVLQRLNHLDTSRAGVAAIPVGSSWTGVLGRSFVDDAAPW